MNINYDEEEFIEIIFIPLILYIIREKKKIKIQILNFSANNQNIEHKKHFFSFSFCNGSPLIDSYVSFFRLSILTTVIKD